MDFEERVFEKNGEMEFDSIAKVPEEATALIRCLLKDSATHLLGGICNADLYSLFRMNLALLGDEIKACLLCHFETDRFSF